MKYVCIFLLLLASYCQVSAQTVEQDSLRQLIENDAVHDSVKTKATVDLAYTYIRNKPDSAKTLTESVLPKVIKYKLRESFSEAYLVLFLYHFYRGEQDEAIALSEKALKELATFVDEDEVEFARLYNRLGFVYREKGAYTRALNLHLKSQAIAELHQDLSLQSNSYNSIGIVYNDQKEYEKALEYFTKALEIDLKTDDKASIFAQYNNIGLAYYLNNQYEEAITYHTKSLQLCLAEALNEDICYAYINLAETYTAKGEIALAIDYVKKGIEFTQLYPNRKMELRGYIVLGWANRELGNYAEAIKYGEKGLAMAKGHQLVEHDFALEQLHQTYKATNQLALAYSTLQAYTVIKDSIANDESKKKSYALEAKYAFEKEKQQIEFEKEKARVTYEASLAEEKLIRYEMSGGILLLVLLLFFAYRTYRIKLKSNTKLQALLTEIEQKNKEVIVQKEKIEFTHKKITDSINYAKKIQGAILPSATDISEFLPNSFVLYKPKDVVSGDFYWLEVSDNRIYFAVADCTGHGVPGALVSVVCHNALNRSVREYQLTDPAEILDQTRAILIEEFGKSKDSVADGMDIALCMLEGDTLSYAGAYNPLWIMQDGELIEIKADRQPIGKFKKPQPFSLHTLQVASGDSIYIFSDGFIDQFGGEDNVKFKAKQLKALLHDIYELPAEKQKEMLDLAFENWKGSQRQIDDVCILGLKLK